ncbi:MAG TPA: hypothetical protein VNT75_31500 [Symbiobacteriaceae bacterium]|nr:hypothetical protein [Symbiobacteriaceae bacterium]
MSERQFTREEQEFMKAVGLDSDNLEWLVQEAPAVSDETTARVLEKTRLKVALAPLTQARPRRTFRLPRWAAVAAAALVICTATVAVSPTVQAALKSLLQLIPGFGVTAVTPGNLVLANPVTVSDDTRKMTVTGLHGTETETVVQLEWDGLSKTADVTPDFAPGLALVLPDGTRLERKTLNFNGQVGTGKLLLKITFPALPAGTRNVRLELPRLFEQTNPVGTLLTLSPAESANLAEAIPVNGGAQKENVSLSVSHLALDGDRIRLMVRTDPAATNIRAVAADLMNGSIPPGTILQLKDDQGNSYPLLFEETALSMNDGGSRTLREGGSSVWTRGPAPLLTRTSPSFTAVFAGPLRPGAKRLTLTLQQAEVVETGSASLTLEAGRLVKGQRVDLNEALQVGGHEVVINYLNQREDDSAVVSLFVKGVPAYHVAVRFNGQHMERSGSADRGRTWLVETPKVPTTPTTEITIDHLKFEVVGPWSVEVPLP